jgi:hypothetical protein
MEPSFEPRIRRLETIMSVAAHFDLLCEWIARPNCAITTLHARLNVGHFPRYLIPAGASACLILLPDSRMLTSDRQNLRLGPYSLQNFSL